MTYIAVALGQLVSHFRTPRELEKNLRVADQGDRATWGEDPLCFFVKLLYVEPVYGLNGSDQVC